MSDRKKVIVAGLSQRFFVNQIAIMKEYSISMIADSSKIKEKMNEYMGYPIGTFEEIKDYDHDEILIVSQSRCMSLINMLLSMGIDRQKIVIWNPKLCLNDSEYSLKVDEKGFIRASVHKGDTRINATLCAFSDLVVFEEIYLKNIYRFVSGEETVLIDVGMNIGLASLFFASKGFINKVYGFEPFKPTYERAMGNLRLNDKSLTEKIRGYNYGLGEADGEQTVHYLADNPGYMRAGKEAVAADPGDESAETAVIKEAGPEILKIMDENPGASFAMKIDCEGAEYEIIPNLIKHGALKRFSIVVMESHYGREEEIIEALRQEGFVVYSNEEALIPLLTAISILIMLFAEPLTRLYYRDPSDPVYMMTVMGFRILPFCMPLSIIMTHFSNYWQASNRSIPVHILSFLDGVAGVVVFSMLLIGRMGVTAVYTANVLNGLIAPVFVLIYACIYNKHFPKSIDELMSVPPEFGVPVYGRIDINLKDMESVIGISNDLQGFCAERGIDRKRAMYASLCLEEMAGNIMEHGMTADNRRHNVRLCLACKPETLIMSIKDDCTPLQHRGKA